MDNFYNWARSLPDNPILPRTLWNKDARAKFLDFVDKKLVSGIETWRLDPIQCDVFKSNLENKTSTLLYDVPKPVDRFIITAVLWAGCLDGAKAIRESKVGAIISPEGPKTVNITITNEERLAMSNTIERVGKVDCLYRYGVEASPILRKVRGQEIITHGIPENSLLMDALKPFLS